MSEAFQNLLRIMQIEVDNFTVSESQEARTLPCSLQDASALVYFIILDWKADEGIKCEECMLGSHATLDYNSLGILHSL